MGGPSSLFHEMIDDDKRLMTSMSATIDSIRHIHFHQYLIFVLLISISHSSNVFREEAVQNIYCHGNSHISVCCCSTKYVYGIGHISHRVMGFVFFSVARNVCCLCLYFMVLWCYVLLNRTSHGLNIWKVLKSALIRPTSASTIF